MNREMEYTMSGLRDRLFKELDNLSSGKSSISKARTTAALAYQIIDSVRVEIIHHAQTLPGGARMLAQKLGAPETPPPEHIVP